jgi:hypothetical protein
MKESKEQELPNAESGGTPASAYRNPNGDTPSNAGDPLTLPPGTSSEKFKDFTIRVSETVGQDNITIITKEEELDRESYLDLSKAYDIFHTLDKDYFVASAVIVPRGVSDVQNVIRLCNEYEIPVWPFSIRRDFGYGGAGE